MLSTYIGRYQIGLKKKNVQIDVISKTSKCNEKFIETMVGHARDFTGHRCNGRPLPH